MANNYPSDDKKGLLSMRPLAGNGAPTSHNGLVVPTPPIDAPQREALQNFVPEIRRGVLDVASRK